MQSLQREATVYAEAFVQVTTDNRQLQQDTTFYSLFSMLQAMGDLDMPFEDVRGPLSNWVSTPEIQRQMKLRFKAFLDQFKDENGVPVYKHRIRDMCIGKVTARSALCYADSTAEQRKRKEKRNRKVYAARRHNGSLCLKRQHEIAAFKATTHRAPASSTGL